jgi:HSP20 family molecular chaperone IbpA
MARLAAAKGQGKFRGKEVAVPISTGDSLATLAAQIREAVGRRAYGFYEARGRQDGQDLADWFRAEEELTPLREQISESKREIIIQAPLEELSDTNLQVGVDTRHVIVTASRDNDAHSAGDRSLVTAKVISLPAEIDPAGAAANSDGSMLTIILPKVRSNQADEAPA